MSERRKFAESLPNGARVIVEVQGLVLAARVQQDGQVVEFVTWLVSNDGHTYCGRYFPRIADAAVDFQLRKEELNALRA